MKKYDFEKSDANFVNGKIMYNEDIKRLCIFKVGKENFSHCNLIEHNLYIYCNDDTVKVIENFY